MASQWRGPVVGARRAGPPALPPEGGGPVAGTVGRAPARWRAGRAALWRATPFWKGSVSDSYRVAGAHLAAHRHQVARLDANLPWPLPQTTAIEVQPHMAQLAHLAPGRRPHRADARRQVADEDRRANGWRQRRDGAVHTML